MLDQYKTWLSAKQFEAANPGLFKSAGLNKTYGDSLVSLGGIGAASRYAPARNAFGAVTNNPLAAGYAKYKNDMGATNQLMTEFGGYLERNKGLKADNVLKDLAAGNMGAYSGYAPEFLDWRGRETKRGNANGMMSSTFGKLLTAVGPAIVTGGAALPMMGRVAVGAGFGGMAGGPLGALTGGAAAGLAPSIKLPGFKAAVSSPVQAIKSVATQMTPANLLRFGASQGASAMGPSAAVPKSTYQANLLRTFRR